MEMVGPARLELATSRLSSVRSNQLSYEPSKSHSHTESTGNLYPTQERRDMRASSANAPDNILRKEVIQPQVPLRLPCYDLVPVADPTVVRCLLKG